jgi:hypothetical protein
MKLTMVRGDNAAVIVSGTWNIEFYTTDEDAWLAASSPVLTITNPDTTTEELNSEDAQIEKAGCYLFRYTVTQPGRHVAQIASNDFSTYFISAYALEVTTEADFPVVGDAVAYADVQVDVDTATDLFEAEKAAQRARCRIPAAYPPDLRLALMRRFKRSVEMRRLSNASDASEFSTSYTATNDPEIRRLENPYRKVLLA